MNFTNYRSKSEIFINKLFTEKRKINKVYISFNT